jgi:ATP-dependent DNA ligase
MPVPIPMLASSSTDWPGDTGWVMQPKWDGFRLLTVIGKGRQVTAFSRHGTRLDDRLGDLLTPLSMLPAGTVLDGELIALAERDRRPVQDFATVGHAALRHDCDAAGRLQYVAFDLLFLAGEDLRAHTLLERTDALAVTIPVTARLRVTQSQPATLAAHQALVALGFEGKRAQTPRLALPAGPPTDLAQTQSPPPTPRHPHRPANGSRRSDLRRV